MATEEGTPALGSIGNPVKFKDQDFKKILEACLRSGEMFNDPAFPAEQRSIGMPEDPDPKKAIKWLRPKVGSSSDPSGTVVATLKVRLVTSGLTLQHCCNRGNH